MKTPNRPANASNLWANQPTRRLSNWAGLVAVEIDRRRKASGIRFESQSGRVRGVRVRRVRVRRGAAALDYVLVMGVILPLAAFLFWACPIIMNLVYEMTCVLISWPFQ